MSTVTRTIQRDYGGSSPRGRGTLPGQGLKQRMLRQRFIPARAGNTPIISPRPPLRLDRFIPARAGNTQSRESRVLGDMSRPVHPRAGGEHLQPRESRPYEAIRFIPARAGNTSAFPTQWAGSSGRFIPARAGNTPAGWRRMLVSTWRFIPARAGNTQSAVPRSGTPAVHPARAGNTSARGPIGSPRTVHPRAGGEHDSDDPDLRNPSRSVHPRAGGEHLCRSFMPKSLTQCAGSSPRGRGTRPVHLPSPVQRLVAGSSPRGRGTHQLATTVRQSTGRFIPARAGNTVLVPLVLPCRAPRFIPARAGNTSAYAAKHQRAAIGSSPRGRGTRMPQHPQVGFGLRIGSSPRGRGTRKPRRVGRGGRSCRFIPARAGNTS